MTQRSFKAAVLQVYMRNPNSKAHEFVVSENKKKNKVKFVPPLSEAVSKLRSRSSETLRNTAFYDFL